MPRARLLHPEFARHEVLGELSHSHRLLFALLPTIADRLGLIEDRPRRIQADLFPYDPEDSLDVDGLLDDLEGAGFLRRYEVDGVKVISIPGFARWQKPHPRERKSELPPPPPITETEGAPKVRPRRTQGTPRQPVSISDPVSDPVSEDLTRPDKPAAPTAEVWGAYASAFKERHGVEPPDGAKARSQLKTLLERIPKADAPHVAAFYLTHNDALYIRAKHPTDLLLRDCSKLWTEWKTGQSVTGTEAREQERTQANVAGWSGMLKGGKRGVV